MSNPSPAAKLREARHRAGMSLRQVVEEIQDSTGRNISVWTLSRVETGHAALKVDLAWEISKVLGVDPFEIVQFDVAIDGLKKSIFGDPALNVRVTTNGWLGPEISMTRTAMRFLSQWLAAAAENDNNWK